MKLKQEYEIDKESYYKPKKYVIKIFPENISKIESLDLRERDQFVNDAISIYLDSYTVNKRQTDFFEKVKKNVSQVIGLIILFILLASVARFLALYSDANTVQMENNFQTLFENYHLQ
ncbi:MAG: hypothetical protein WCF95_04725 [bacterium]